LVESDDRTTPEFLGHYNIFLNTGIFSIRYKIPVQ
jgi:hypothetical protein